LVLTARNNLASSDPATSWAQDCAAAVKRHDRDRYLASLFAPEPSRGALLALYAFSLEVARIPELVSEPMLGEIRLQWWREALEEVYENRPRLHPVVQGLAEAAARTPLSREHFDRLVDARSFDLEQRPPATLADLETYAAATSSGLLRLGLEILEARGNAAIEAASRLGIAWALIGYARSLPFHAGQGRIYLPEDLMENCGLSSTEVLTLKPSDAVRACVQRLVERAETHLVAARQSGRGAPRRALPVLLLGRAASLHARVLRTSGYDPYDPRVPQAHPNMAWRFAWSYCLNRI